MNEQIKTLDPDAKAVLRQMQTGLTKIAERDAEIENLTAAMADLKPAVIEFNTHKTKLKELKRLNDDDKEFMHRSMKWYEERTGVETHKEGTLFSVDEEEGGNGKTD